MDVPYNIYIFTDLLYYIYIYNMRNYIYNIYLDVLYYTYYNCILS